MEEVLNRYVTNPNPTPTLTPNLNPNPNSITLTLTLTKLIRIKIQKESTLEIVIKWRNVSLMVGNEWI
jgi:hypothetical protein